MTPDSSPTDLDAVFGLDVLDDPGLEAVRELFDGLRSDFASGPPPVPRADLAALLGTAPEPVRADDRAVVTLASRVRSRGIRFRHRIVAGAAALVAAAGITTGLAAAQALPAPVQRVVADALDQIGIHVDGGSKPAPHTNVGPGGPATHGSSSTATTTAPGGGNNPGAPGASATVPTSLPGLPPAPGGLPPVTLPGVTLPPISVPVTLPPGSPVNVPQLPLPPVSLPGASLPGTSLPRLSSPGTSLPGTSLPAVSIPRVTLPPLTSPVQLPPVTPPTLPHLFG
jgi:hypothetical protein